MTPNDFFKEFAIGKLQIETDSQAFYYHSSIGSTIDAYVINIDKDTRVSLLYIPTTENMTGLFIFAKKGTDGEFYEFFSKDPVEFYSNVGEFGHRDNKKQLMRVDVGSLTAESKYKAFEMVKTIDFSSNLKNIGSSMIVGNFYFELSSDNFVTVREFKK